MGASFPGFHPGLSSIRPSGTKTVVRMVVHPTLKMQRKRLGWGIGNRDEDCDLSFEIDLLCSGLCVGGRRFPVAEPFYV